MDTLLTEANWKTKGLPLRSIKEKLTQKKTGISEALRALAEADKAVRAELLNITLVKKLDAVLSVTETSLKKLKAEDKKLLALCSDMVKAIAGYRSAHNAEVGKIERATIGGLPGGLKMMQKQAEKEFSTENQIFVEGARKVSSDALKIMTFIAGAKINELNISNEGRWKTLADERAAWEKQVKLALEISMRDIVKNQIDTVNRLKNACRL